MKNTLTYQIDNAGEVLDKSSTDIKRNWQRRAYHDPK